jgi:quercetin dioxygenase-like cupin family protein
VYERHAERDPEASARGAGILRRSEPVAELEGSGPARSARSGSMDVRSIEDVAPVVEHNGTVPVWWLVNPREMKEITDGGFLELVSEFEVAGGGLVDPHSHPTHEFYYVTAGRGLMTIDGEEREIVQGDLVHIPPDLVHSLRPVSDHAPIHCFCFAVGVKDAGAVDYTKH